MKEAKASTTDVLSFQEHLKQVQGKQSGFHIHTNKKSY